MNSTIELLKYLIEDAGDQIDALEMEIDANPPRRPEDLISLLNLKLMYKANIDKISATIKDLR